jgi:P27 family predicted phage terminase small subunit
MGARGPQPTPTRLKVIAGNPGKRALNKSEPRPAAGLTRPIHITGAMAKEWDRTVAAMPPGFFTEADVPVLSIYCEALTLRRKALSIIARKREDGGGEVVAGSAGQAAAHPMIAVASKQAEIILKAADRLGMSPAARTRLSAPDEEQLDEIEERYFGRPN